MQVDIDEAQLDREFDARIALAPPPLEGDVLTAGGQEWHKLLREFKAVHFAHTQLAPAWSIDPDRLQDLENAAGDVLERVWPGGLANADQWGPWAKLAYVLAAIAMSNFDPERMRFNPLRAAEVKQEQPTQEPERDHPES